LALAYIFYSRYILRLAEKQFQNFTQLSTEKKTGETNLEIARELEKKIELYLEESHQEV
jgi:hypothetical protein